MKYWYTKNKQILKKGFWTPAEITTQVWYDASDLSTITEGVSGVSQWDDKSGNDNHLKQSTGTGQPITNSRTQNGLNVLDFDGINHWMYTDTAWRNSQDDTGIFVVYQNDDHTADVNDNLLQDTNGDGTGRTLLYNYAIFDDWATFVGGSRIKLWDSTSNFEMTSLECGASIGVNSWLNGNAQGSTENIPETNNGCDLVVGSNKDGGGTFWNGTVGEIIFVTNITDELRQKIEGYLAWKWGLV